MKTNTAVLHLKSKDPQKTYNLGGKVITNMEISKAIFRSPEPTFEIFGMELTKLDVAIKAKDGSKVKNQAIFDQTEIVYTMLKLLLFYVNKVANGDKTIILLSGFDCSDDPVKHDKPEKALIRRVEDGSEACSAKIYVEPLTDADRYKIEITSSLGENTKWETILDFGTLNKLEIKNLIRAQEVYIRISGGNIYGWGTSSEPIAFIPR